MRLFVYGSLKKGFFNHNRFGFGQTATFLGPAVVNGVSLVQAGNLPYPHAVVREEGTVKGELYELVDDEIIESLDAMEYGAGYKQHEVNINGEPAVMYVAQRPIEGSYMDEWKENES